MLLAGIINNASAQISDGVIKIGVLSNQSTVGADASGVAAATAARLAVEDFGGAINGVPIEVIDEDFAEKPDTAALIARRWFDTEKVDVIADMPVSSAALAVQEIARNAKKTLLVGGAVTADLTGKACSPFTTHWTDNSRSLTSAVVQGVTEKPGETWFFVSVDYALGASLQRDASAEIERLGGKVVGGVRYPLGSPDLASFLLQAQASKAHFIGLGQHREGHHPRHQRSAGIPHSGDRVSSWRHSWSSSATSTVSVLRRHKASMSRPGFIGIKTSKPESSRSGCLRVIKRCRPKSRPRSMRPCATI